MGSHSQITLRPSEIRFTQDSISDEFGRDTGETLAQTFKELLYGEKTPEDIRPLAVVQWQNKYWVVSGNRRLYIYRKLEDLGRVRVLTVNKRNLNTEKFFEMKTTKNEGTWIRVRGKNNLVLRMDSIIAEWKRRGRPTSGLPESLRRDDTDYHRASSAGSIYSSGSLRSSTRSTRSTTPRRASTSVTSPRTNTYQPRTNQTSIYQASTYQTRSYQDRSSTSYPGGVRQTTSTAAPAPPANRQRQSDSWCTIM